MKITEELKNQVSLLSEEEKNKVLKIGRFYAVALIIVALPVFAYVIYNIVLLTDIDKNFDRANILITRNLVALGILFAYIISSLIFTKIKFPFYSDKKFMCIKKEKKQ